MATKIRLQRHGRSKRPYYYIVVADSRARRDGKFIDRIGDYNPLTIPATINIDFDKAFDWVMKGAEPTDTAKKILSYKGVLYKKHLARGVRKGAMTPEEMEKKMAEWMDYKTNKIAARVEKLSTDKAAKKAAKQADEEVKREAYAAKLREDLSSTSNEAEAQSPENEDTETTIIETAAETTEDVVTDTPETPAE